MMKKMTNCMDNLKNCKGKCCTFFRIEMPDLTDDTRRYFELHGIKVIDPNILHFDIPCKQFDPETKTCKIYETRPELCKQYPREWDPIPDKCIYQNKKKVQKGLVSKLLKKIFKGDNMAKKEEKEKVAPKEKEEKDPFQADKLFSELEKK